MIKKLIAFVVLVAAGLAVMHFVVGWENFATSRGSGDEGSAIKGRDTGETGIVVGNLGKETRDAITIVASGRMTISSERLWPLPDGSFRPLTKDLLNAEDSRPVPDHDDQIELIGVRVQFFDVDDRDPWNPRRVEAAILEADSALLQLGRDESGRASVLENRDMDLRVVVMRTVPSEMLQAIEMRVDQLLVRHAGEAGISLRTPTDAVPFEVVLGGDDPMTLRGVGLRASMPSDDVPDDAVRFLEMHIASRPVLVRGASRLSAAGSLHYREDTHTGVGHVHLRDRVRAEGVLRINSDSDRTDPAADPLVATGDSIYAVLARRNVARDGAKRSDSSAAWTKFRLLGSPAILSGNGVELRCEQVDALPSIDGQPHVFTASGTPRLEQARDGVTFDAERIHLVRLADYLAALHRPFGFHDDAFGFNLQEFLVFEGAATVIDNARDTEVHASEGIRVLRTQDRDGPALSIGHGAVRVTRTDLVATGSDGFRIVQANPDSQTLRLGPDRADEAHWFTIRRDGEQTFEVQGHGRCIVQKFEAGGHHLELESPLDDLVAKLDDGTLVGVHRLNLNTDANGELLDLEAFGDECRFAKEVGRGDEQTRIAGTAKTVRAFGKRHLILAGTPARIERESDGSVVRGGSIELFDSGTRTPCVVVTRDAWSEQAQARLEPHGTELTSPVDLMADRIVMLPRLLPESVLAFHTGGLGRRSPGFDLAVGAWARTPHIVANGAISIEQGGDRAFIARGEDLFLRLDGSAGLLTGNPAQLTQASDADERTTVAWAKRLRIGRSSLRGSETITLLPSPGFDPILELHSAASDNGGGIRNARVVASGRIQATRERIDFEGPVEVFELGADGEPLPDGIHLASNSMDAHADDNGVIRDIVAHGDATMWVRGGTIRGDEITVDVTQSRAVVWRENGYAEFLQPSGKLIRGRRLEVDYKTMSFAGWDLRLGMP